MDPAANQRVSPGRVVLILALLLGVWLAFQFYPRRKEPVPSMPPVKAESKLQDVGLANNPDWEGLPEFFAIWAEKPKWSDNKTWFAYWNPGTGSYSYLFEAMRQGTKFRFRQISPTSLVADGQDDFHALDSFEGVREVMERRLESDTHPLIFIGRFTLKAAIYLEVPKPQPSRPASRVEVDLKSNNLEAPKPPDISPQNDNGK